jgi:hypothetical protein
MKRNRLKNPLSEKWLFFLRKFLIYGDLRSSTVNYGQDGGLSSPDSLRRRALQVLLFTSMIAAYLSLPFFVVLSLENLVSFLMQRG